MLGTHVPGHHPDGRKQDGRIIAITDQRKDVGNKVERQDEVREGTDQRGFHLQRRVMIEGAIVCRQKIFGERQPCGDAPCQPCS